MGIKPTLGLVSRSGVIPISHSQDTPGPMARCVADAALVLGAMAGVDERDPATAASQEHLQQDYAAFLDPHGLKGSRLGVPRSLYKMHPFVKKLAENCLEILKRNGAELVELPDLGGAEKTGETEVEVLLYEFKADLNAYLSALGPQARVHSLDELIEYNEQHRERIMPFFGQERFLAAQAKGALTDEAYRKALETNHRLSREEGIDAAIKEHRLDAIVAPTNDPAWLVDLINGDHHGTAGCSSRQRSPAIRISPSLRGTSIACRLGCPSSAPPGPSRCCCAWPIALSRPRRPGVRRLFCLRQTLANPDRK